MRPSRIIIQTSVGATLTADAGTFVWSGTSAALSYHRVISAGSGAFAWSGTDATLLRDRVLSAASGAFAWSGSAATLRVLNDSTIVAESGSFPWSGTDATLSQTSVVGGTYNIAAIFPTGSTVTVALYDPVTGLAVSLISASATEIGSTGLYVWGANNLTTQPTSYQEYLYTISDGTTTEGGIVHVGSYLDKTEKAQLASIKTSTDTMADDVWQSAKAIPKLLSVE